MLGRVLDRAAGGVVVFDLDSTLLDNRPRQARILRELGAARGLAALAAARPEHWQDWSIKRAMANAGLARDEIAGIADDAKRFWSERFFTSEYCAVDEAIAGAVDYVRQVGRRGGVVAYCTGRHEAMRPGTLASFARLGFPVENLLMKPTFAEHDDAWKVRACAELGALGRIVAAFDNEPTHINIYRAAFPDAAAVHVATDDSGRPVALADGVVSVRDFRM